MSQCDPLDHIKEYFWRNPGYDFVEESDLNRSNDTSLPGAIAFDECSTLFQSDTVVCAAIHGQDCAARFQRGFYVRPKHDNAYHLDCTVISKDGDIFHHKKVAFEIPEFEGTKLINELPVHPLDYHSDVEGIKRFLHERGKAILKLNGTRHKEYEGVAIEQSPTGPTEHHVSFCESSRNQCHIVYRANTHSSRFKDSRAHRPRLEVMESRFSEPSLWR